jgi:hypothetical protein
MGPAVANVGALSCESQRLVSALRFCEPAQTPCWAADSRRLGRASFADRYARRLGPQLTQPVEQRPKQFGSGQDDYSDEHHDADDQGN